MVRRIAIGDDMGSVTFSLEIEADCLQSAYKEACNDAVYEHGKGIYNGTISTTSGVVDKTDVLISLITEEFKYAPHDEFGAALNKWKRVAWDSTVKWDVAWGAKIADKEYILAGWAAE